MLYKNNRKMRTVVAQIRAAWYGAEAGSVGVGGAGKPAKTGVNCEGLVNKAIAEAQRMVDEFKGNGVWGQLAPDEEADAWVPFGYSGMQVDRLDRPPVCRGHRDAVGHRGRGGADCWHER